MCPNNEFSKVWSLGCTARAGLEIILLLVIGRISGSKRKAPFVYLEMHWFRRLNLVDAVHAGWDFGSFDGLGLVGLSKPMFGLCSLCIISICQLWLTLSIGLYALLQSREWFGKMRVGTWTLREVIAAPETSYTWAQKRMEPRVMVDYMKHNG